MRKIKNKLILILMIISLIGVGFATWSIYVPIDDATEGGDFVVDDVVLVEALSSPVFDTELRYNKNGFFTQHTYNPTDQSFTSKTYDKIKYSIDVNLPLCKEKLGDADSFNVRIRLKPNAEFENLNDILELIGVKVSIDNLDNYSVNTKIDETINEIIVNVSIPKSNVGTVVSKVSVTYDFSNVSIKETFLHS